MGESLDYLKLCSNYYTNWEDGCCMESCTINDMNECPIHYVKGLLEEKDKAIENWETMYKGVMQTCHNDKEEIERLNKQLALSEKALQIVIFELDFAKNHSQSTSQECIERIERLKTEIWNRAKEMMKSE